MQVQRISNQNNQESFGARMRHNTTFIRDVIREDRLNGCGIPEHERFLKENFPDHILRLDKEGISNVTTEKYHKFPFKSGEKASLLEIFRMFILTLQGTVIDGTTKEDSQKFVKELFE